MSKKYVENSVGLIAAVQIKDSAEPKVHNGLVAAIDDQFITLSNEVENGTLTTIYNLDVVTAIQYLTAKPVEASEAAAE